MITKQTKTTQNETESNNPKKPTKNALKYLESIQTDTNRSQFELWIAEKSSSCKGLSSYIHTIATLEAGAY